MRNVKLLWGVIGVLLIAVLVLSSVLTANSFKPSQASRIPDQTNQADKQRVIATVGELSITNLNLEEQLKKKYGRELLNQMIDHEVIRMEGSAQGITVNESELKQELKRMQQGYDNEAQFYQAMKDQLGFTPEALRADVTDKLLIEKLATKNIRIGDDAVDAYIRTHPEEFRSGVQLRLQQIVVSGKDQAAKVMADLAKGMEFAQVAKERSLDDATRDTGGDLGWVEEDDPFIAEPILKAAKQLGTGEVSKPFDIGGKLAIIRVKDRKERGKEAQDAIREKVRKELALQEAPPIKEVLGKLRDKWKVQILETF
ncbi:peptidyl-prolyl cis-trans isomerase [Paenibacillus filicis]|uniref:peptidylprolyl isomerase n=1 Tax=Paenibacillus gyeongsangnamensis TaxID=3388067 RepID=A0ABT4QL55_9BACL|nr:peptidyl-prolyl cis-trans isomerase [Paenibacillus filicis]MCZ8517593.1 peptidyl-prolyl cis-trans isomerase [Paenibacillus filicis]